MFGKAAMIAVLLAPMASIARHDDHRTDAELARSLTALRLPWRKNYLKLTQWIIEERPQVKPEQRFA
jgi:hypothetical protein